MLLLIEDQVYQYMYHLVSDFNVMQINSHRIVNFCTYVQFFLENPNEVKVPTLYSKKPKAYKSVTGELSTRYNADVVVRPSGQVIVKRSKTQGGMIEKHEDDDITDAEIIRENKKVDKVEQTSK